MISFLSLPSMVADTPWSMNLPSLVAFGKPSFRGRQKEIMEAAMHGADVLVVAPTGMGKRYVIEPGKCD